MLQLSPAFLAGRSMLNRAELDNLESARRDLLQLIELGVVPLRIRFPRDEPIRSVIGDEHAVLLETRENGLDGRIETADVEAALESYPEAHGWTIHVGGRTRKMRRRMNERALGVFDRESKRVAYLVRDARLGLSHEPR